MAIPLEDLEVVDNLSMLADTPHATNFASVLASSLSRGAKLEDSSMPISGQTTTLGVDECQHGMRQATELFCAYKYLANKLGSEVYHSMIVLDQGLLPSLLAIATMNTSAFLARLVGKHINLATFPVLKTLVETTSLDASVSQLTKYKRLLHHWSYASLQRGLWQQARGPRDNHHNLECVGGQ